MRLRQYLLNVARHPIKKKTNEVSNSPRCPHWRWLLTLTLKYQYILTWLASESTKWFSVESRQFQCVRTLWRKRKYGKLIIIWIIFYHFILHDCCHCDCNCSVIVALWLSVHFHRRKMQQRIIWWLVISQI